MDKIKRIPRAAIVTWCYNNGKTNYGQILQCYAVQVLFQKLGYQTKVVRYRRREDGEKGALDGKSQFFIDLYELWYRLVKVEQKLDGRIVKFIFFIKKNIFLSKQCYTKKQVENVCADCDVLVCGSDQIWNPEWFEDIYALNFGRDSQKRIACAPSGVIVENENNEKIYRELGKYIDRFEFVAVREKLSENILSKYTKKKIVDMLDPTLLLSQGEWDRVAAGHVSGEPYIFCYSLGKLRPHKVLLREIMKKYRAERILFLVSGFYENETELERGGYFYPVKYVGPAQFLGLIRDACAVCTDSFHGVALSIVYQKQFFVLKRMDSQADINANFARQENLLEKVGIGKKRLVRCVREVDAVEEIDYEKLQVGRQIKKSEFMLKRALERETENT